MKIHLPLTEVTNRLFGHYAYEQGQELTTQILPGIIAASTTVKLVGMETVTESAAEIVQAKYGRKLVSRRNEIEIVTLHGDDAEAVADGIGATYRTAAELGIVGLDSVVELMSLCYELDNGGFDQVHDLAMQESYERIQRTFPAIQTAA